MYPLHMALRRLRLNARGREGESRTRSHRVGCVWELIRAGADVRARDGRGNTALHYMADDDPASVWPDLGPERRQLLYALLKDCGADVNARNNDGRTVAELLLDDDNKFEEAKIQAGKEAPWQAIDEEVFAALDAAGVDWLAPTSEGESLLLPVARCQLAQLRTVWRAQYLVAKGLNPNTADKDGTPVRQVAESCYNPFLVEYFDKALQRQALDYCVEWKAGKGTAT
ncbi:hypothetical protein NLG97_g7530 [Lecanicillium saksenae]|uniref:Uncharacterized protein n=1 Tax=Lecanicillium saksenae TaxID=468837 RepID=A0ACC1QN43_9HYPO|nr:hypothetical protein NLG97_g7530 [Lecanicillium saksenae]